MENHLYCKTLLPKILATKRGQRMKGMMKKRVIPQMLKMQWQRASCSASLVFWEPEARAARRLGEAGGVEGRITED